MKKLRLADVFNFVWATVHDFLYMGIAVFLYWLWHQPSATRNSLIIIVAIAVVFIVETIVNYRQHMKIEKRLSALERKCE
jgi:RsiW-degrading membrane proteinase PrsW (M82 family)